MAFLFTLAMIVVFVACVAMLMPQGTWAGAIMLINVVTAALLATNLWEPTADLLEKWIGARATYLVDFVAVWGLFALFVLLARVGTDFASRIRVRFMKPVEIAGSFFFAGWVGWVMICFTLFTLHMAPLARNFLGGAFQPERRMLSFAPDRQWLGFMQKESLGAFSRGDPTENHEAHVFDPKGEFMLKYASRRKQYETVQGVLTK